MTPGRKRAAAVGLGVAAAAAAVAANLVLLGQARSDDPLGRLSPSLRTTIAPPVTVPARTDDETTPTAPEPPRTDHDRDDD